MQPWLKQRKYAAPANSNVFGDAAGVGAVAAVGAVGARGVDQVGGEGCSNSPKLVLCTALDACTVMISQEADMQSTFRQIYQPKPNRTPAWLRQLWRWL